jgi:hypothetical protein
MTCAGVHYKYGLATTQALAGIQTEVTEANGEYTGRSRRRLSCCMDY